MRHWLVAKEQERVEASQRRADTGFTTIQKIRLGTVELLNVYLSKGCVLPIRRLLLSLHWTATALTAIERPPTPVQKKNLPSRGGRMLGVGHTVFVFSCELNLVFLFSGRFGVMDEMFVGLVRGVVCFPLAGWLI